MTRYDQVAPRINVNDSEYEIIQWFVEDNKYVQSGDPILTIETSKAAVEIRCEKSGYIKRWHSLGDLISVGGVLFSVFETLELAKSAHLAVRFSDAAIKLVEKNQIKKEHFAGLGLVTEKMVQKYLDERSSGREGKKNITLAKKNEIEKLSLAQTDLLKSSLTVQFQSVELRKSLQSQQLLSGQVLPVILFYFSKLLQKYPKFNSYFVEGAIHYYDRIHIGIALDLGKGLRVPVMKDANDLNPIEIQKKLAEIAIQYLDQKLGIADLSDATVTVSDLSSDNIIYFQPLLNLQQSVVLGIGGDQFQMGHPMTLTLVFDHRVLTGREVSIFLNELRRSILNFKM